MIQDIDLSHWRRQNTSYDACCSIVDSEFGIKYRNSFTLKDIPGHASGMSNYVYGIISFYKGKGIPKKICELLKLYGTVYTPNLILSFVEKDYPRLKYKDIYHPCVLRIYKRTNNL